MRILQVGPLPPEAGGDTAGGISTHLWALARNLARRGHDVAVLADNVRFSEPWPARVEGIDVFGTAGFAGSRRLAALPGRAGRAVPRIKAHFGRGWSWRWVASKAAAFAAAQAAFSPDVVHVHAPEARFPYAAFLSRAPVVATVHSIHYIEFAPRDRKEAHRALVERNLALASDLIFVSRYVEAQYAALFPEAMPRIRRYVLPNPIDATRYRPVPAPDARARLGLAADERVLLFVGALIPRKDPASLLEAVAVLRDRGRAVRALVVGEGPELESLRRLACERGIEGAVRFEGVRPAEELSDYYSAADLFVFPSRMESFGLVYLEALLCGRPVVGCAEVLDEILPGDGFGTTSPPGDPAALADAVERSLARDWDASEMRRYAESFDWPMRIEGFERIYEDVTHQAPYQR